MKFTEFVEVIKGKVEQLLEGKATATVHEVLKNNGIKLTGISIGNNNSNLAPTVYLEAYWKRINGDSKIISISEGMLQDVAEEIVMMSKKYRCNPTMSFEWFEDWSQVKNRLAVKLINRNRNSELLNDVPYRLVLDDLAMIAYMILPKENNIKDCVIGNITIRNDHLGQWGKTANELMEVALKNTPKILPDKVCNMNNLIAEMIGEVEINYENIEDLNPVTDTFLVLSNTEKMYGATVLLYPNVLKRIANIMQADIYILPSSVHELILLPVITEVSCNNLREMVLEVNQSSVVSEEEILTNTVYVYRRENDTVQVA